MAEKACHGFGSTTQVGLTQALGASNLELKRFSASVASGGHSTPVVAGFGRSASVIFFGSRTRVLHRFARPLRRRRAARGCGDIAGPVGAASESSPLTVRGVRPVIQASVHAIGRAHV